MSSTGPNNTDRTSRTFHARHRSKKYQARTTPANSEQSTTETSVPYDEDFPALLATTSNQAAAAAVNTSNRSNIHEQQSLASNNYSQSSHNSTNHNIQRLIRVPRKPSQIDTIEIPSARENLPVTVPQPSASNVPHFMAESRSTTTITNHLMQSITMKSDITTDNNSSSTPPRPFTARENDINNKLCEIIFTIHGNKKFVSREKVQKELFNHFHVNSWHELGVQTWRFNALLNITDRQKGVTFYMHIFEQIFNLCTLHDLEPLLARFLGVNTYEDLRLGPLDQNPEVQRIFNYKPTNSDQPIPIITTGDVIKRFQNFQKKHSRQREMPFGEFLDELVKIYQVQSREELGIFCRSFPFLVQVTNKVRRDEEVYMHQVQEETERGLIEEVRARLEKLKEEMRDEQELSSFNKKKTPTAVFNYLTSIVDKYLDIVPQQPVLYRILIQLREDELLRCLFNMSIYLGTIDKPEVFITELKKLYDSYGIISQTQELMTTQELPNLNIKMSKKDRKKMATMIQQKQSPAQSSNTKLDEPNTTAPTPFSTNFASSLSASHTNKSKPPISFKQLCSDIYTRLVRFDTVLTIEQLVEVDRDLCIEHGVANFSAFVDDENDNSKNPMNFLSFLEKHRQTIDPHGELSVYEHTASSGDQAELYAFLQQLSVIHNDEIDQEHQQQHVALAQGHINSEQLHLSAEQLSAVEKAIKHKFGGTISLRKRNQLIKKAKQRYRKNKYSIIRFEESLLDVNGLNRLSICPTSMNVNETQLCLLILHCPFMTELHTWLQWLHFFQPKYGALKSFIAKHEQAFKNLRLLETSTQELFRLPIDTTLATFEHELNTMHIRSAVGHLCALIVQEGLVTHFSFNVYRTSMDAWFRHLRSLSAIQSDHVNPMQCILDFIMYLPVLIGQSRVIAELVLRPLDDVFNDDRADGINARTRIWNLADSKQKTKLELWGHTVNITEWKNEDKWLGNEDLEEKSTIKSKNEIIQKQNINTTTSVASTTTTVESLPISTSNATSNTTTTTPTAVFINDGDDSAQAAFEHIELIRRGFGVISGHDSSDRTVVNNLQGVVQRSLEKLSTDLYSDQGHFVLELIQNADDNQYTDGSLPTLRFNLSPERILVCNNEIGFQPRDISAICDVGASTKGKHKQGYAGHKGIGFKSVFMVSHRPEIHSRNYHFRFDTVDGTQQIGYILPIWIDQYEEILPNSEEWTTSIRLPIKRDTRRDQLQQNFDDIQARLLLFLNRLRQIEIVNQQDISSTNNSCRIFTRIDHAQGQIIELQEKTVNGPLINNFWLVVKKVIDVPTEIKMKLRDVKGAIDSTTIAIAYPLSGIQDSSTQLPPSQPLFAYLPLRKYGFRFILQADFEIPATRQEVRRDNLWNEWLKSEMTCLLSLAYRQFQCLPDLLASSSIDTQINAHLTPIQTIKYFLKLIPSRSELDPYFNTFVDNSIKSLMGILKLPVSRQNEKDETIIDWVLPSQCVIVRDPFIRKILSQDLLLSHFNCYYIHEQLALECDEQIFLDLGCRQLDFSDITQLIELSYKQDEQKHPKTTSTIEQIAQWLVCLDYSLQQQRDETHHTTHEKDTLAKLKQLKIIPLKQQSYLVSVDEFEKHAISFPLDKSTRFSRHLKLVLDDIPTLDEQLLDFIEDKHPRRLDSIKRLLQKLGISEGLLNIREIYRQHILPAMSNPTRWSSKSEPVLIAYLLCIYENIYLLNRDVFDNDLKILQNTMVIKTRDNTFVSLGSPDVVVHLPSTYGSKMSLDSLRLSKFKFTYISDDYYTYFRADIARNDNDKYEFISFLKELNLNDFLQVNAVNTPFINVPQLANTQWAYLIRPLTEMVHEPFIIRDYHCEEFNKLVSSSDENQTAHVELCVQLLQYLDKHHRAVSVNYAASVMLARAHKYGNATPIKAIESSFCLSLRQHAWIPVVGDILYKPSDVYFLRQNNETSVFRRYVPHLDISKLSLNDDDFIHNILGIKSHVTHQTMFELLMKWSCDLDSESLWNLVKQTNTSDIIPCTLPSTFRQTCLDVIDNFRQIYHFLASNDETRFLLSRFRLWPLIFIPRDQTTGDFLYVHQTFWNDPIFLLSSQDAISDSKGRIPIRPYYDNDSMLQEFFPNILHVESQPTIDDYLPLLSTVQDIAKIWQIIEIITKLATEQNKQQEVREKCLDIAFIPCIANKQKLVKYTDHPFYPHNTDIANLFADTLPIIKLPDFNFSTEFKEHFCLLFDIENLGKVIQTKIDVENEQPSTSLADFYRCSIDLIQHFLLRKKLISDVQSNHFAAIFARMQFISVNRIDLSYCYGTNIVKIAPTSHGIDTYIDEQTCKFYILKKFETSEMRYTDAMANFIIDDKLTRSELLSQIKTLLQVYQKDGAQGLANFRENLTENYEPKWTIPEDIKKHVPEVLQSKQEEETTPFKKVEVTNEQIKLLSEEPVNRPKPRPKEVTNEEDANRLISFPERPGINESKPIIKDPSKVQSKPKSDDSTEVEHTLSFSTSDSSNQNHRASQDYEQGNNEQAAPKNRSNKSTESNEGDTKVSNDQFNQSHAPVIFSDPSLLSPPSFEHIAVSTLSDPDLFTSIAAIDESPTTDPFHVISSEADLMTGRLGEELVFRYLKRECPNEDIEWMNEKIESGKPYDIRIVNKSEKNQKKFIEVKTTRSADQNTFPVSIGEVEYLLKNPSNYFIYRVYYADGKKPSTITVLNKIQDNLISKHLKLSMTVISKPSD